MTEIAPTDSAPPEPLGRGTLGRRLVIRVAALVALMAILLSTATTLAVRWIVLDNVDAELRSAAVELKRDLGSGRGRGRGGLFEPGTPVGTFAYGFSPSGTVYPNRKLDGFGQDQTSPLPELTAASLRELTPQPNLDTVNLPELGRYRVITGQLVDTDAQPVGTVVIGVPLAEADRLLVLLVISEAALAALVIGLAVLAARPVIQRSLRPLNRVAATAEQVSTLPLDRGEVALAVRVPPDDVDTTSEVGRVGTSINRMLDNVSGALEARHASEMKVRQFVADASHELRNPLAAIRGYAELTRRHRDDLPADTAYAMARVESEAKRMSALVQDLLLLARLDSGPDLDLQPVDLTELVLNAVSDARVAGPDHVWTLVLPEEPVTARGDAHRLHQVLTNLLANARTHTPPGTRVETAVGIADGQALVTVTDHGPGIPPDIQASVFERFTRADTSRVRAAGQEQTGSTGLGLAIVAAVVEAHQGWVGVQSEPGRTQFAVRLPLA